MKLAWYKTACATYPERLKFNFCAVEIMFILLTGVWVASKDDRLALSLIMRAAANAIF